MKKFIVFVLAAFLAMGFVGTAGAQDFVKNLLPGEYLTPIVADGQGGATVWVVSSSVEGASTGASIFQINPSNPSVSGCSSYLNIPGINPRAGTSATVGPVLWTDVPGSREGGVTLVVQVKHTPNSTPIAGGYVYGGTSLYAYYFTPNNGGGTTHWNNNAISLSHSSAVTEAVSREYISTTSGWGTHLLYDTDGALGGSSVFGTSGVGVGAASNGASIWSIALGNVAGGARLNSNQWSASTQAGFGVSSFFTPLAITGNSLFAIGEWKYYETTGVSLLMFDKRKLAAGPKAVSLQVNAGSTLYPAPAIAGNSIFVVDGAGGLTAYSIHPANQLGFTQATDSRRLGNASTSVSAAPVTDGAFLAVAANHGGDGAGVSVFRIYDRQINASSGVSWWFAFGAGTTISATPVISNGNLFVAVNDSTGGKFYRFALSRTAQGRITAADTTTSLDANSVPFGAIESGGMILCSNRLIALSNTTKRIYSINVGAWTDTTDYWHMFKFDAARKGLSQRTPVAGQRIDDDDSTCFISTIK